MTRNKGGIARKVVIASAVALTWSMLGGGVAFAALSESEWETEAAAICTDSDNAVGEAAASLFEGLGPEDEPSDDQMEEFRDEINPIIEDAIQEVVDLDEPQSLKKNVKKWAKAARATLAKAEDDANIYLTQDPFAKANKIAKKMGLRGCD